MTVHEQIVAQYEAYIAENQKFFDKGVKASAARARKALGELSKLAKERRKEIQDAKNEA
jgi:N-glycosylase/DNA lyase